MLVSVNVHDWMLPGIKEVMKLTEYGALKHGNLNLLEPDGTGTSIRDNTASMFRHTAAIAMGQRKDPEHGGPHAAALIFRGMMEIVRHERGLVHPSDKRQE